MKKKKHFGSSFEDFLKEEGIFEETTTQAVKRVLSWQITQAMKGKGISKMEMAKRIRTSRSQLDRFLDPNNDKVLFETVQRAASAIGKRVSLSLEECTKRKCGCCGFAQLSKHEEFTLRVLSLPSPAEVALHNSIGDFEICRNVETLPGRNLRTSGLPKSV